MPLLVLLATQAWLLVGIALHYSPTLDEAAHLPSGLSHWRFGRFDLYSVNPPLVQGVAALPLLAAGCEEDWSRYDAGAAARLEFAVGADFISANGPRSVFLYRLGRFACIPFVLAGTCGCYLFGRDLYGRTAGLLAAALWSFCPNVLGNGALITPDVPAAALGILAVYAFWRWSEAPSLRRALIAGAALAAAELAKTTWILLFVLLPTFWVAAVRLRTGDVGESQGLRRQVGQLLVCLSTAVLLLNACYLFTGTFTRLGAFEFVSRTLSGDDVARLGSGNRFRGTPLGEVPVPLPRDYVQGLDLQKASFEKGAWSYVRGMHRRGGWWWWYLYAFWVKVPHGTMVLLALACCAPHAGRTRLGSRIAECLLASVVLTLFVLVSSQTGFTRYFRYVLPAMPFLFVLAAKSAALITPRRPLMSIVVCGAAAWAVAGTLRIHPHELAHFNEAAGGPSAGSFHLLDANIDWGQELLHLEEWRAAHADKPLYLSYFDGHFVPFRDLGIPAKPVAGGYGRVTSMSDIERLPEGYYAISVNYLAGYRHTGGTPDLDMSAFNGFTPIDTIGYAIAIYELDPVQQGGTRRGGGRKELPY